MTLSANPIQACIDTLVSPATAFATIKEKKSWSWLPFILVVGATFSLFMYFYQTVDFNWMIEQMADGMAASGKSEEQAKAFQDNMTHSMMQWSTIIGGTVGIIVINLLMALYYYLATKVAAKNDYKFTDWYGFTWWVSLPIVVSALLSALVIFFADNGQISLHDLQPTSLNGLLFGLDQSSHWFAFLEGINLFSFWTLAIATIGLKAWLNITTNKALSISATPFIVIYGSWALYIAFLA
ncbi:MAG: YIP1 family protein [Alteromonadaceae bacterium]|nr:YIP1 family protein [Alteromonadaceae bacterium]